MLRHPSSLRRRAVLAAVLAVTLLTLQSTPVAAQTPQFLASWACTDVRGLAVSPSGVIHAVAGDRVDRYSSEGAFLDSWPIPAPASGGRSDAYGIATDRTDHVYVADYPNNRVIQFSNSGAVLLQWGVPGYAPGQILEPVSLACKADGNVYVGQVSGRIQEFTPEGVYVRTITAINEGFGHPMTVLGIAVGPSGTIYATDWGWFEVYAFSPTGVTLFNFDYPRNGDDGLLSPHGIALDPNGIVYVSEPGRDRVRRYTAAGAYLGQFGTRGAGEGQLNYPHGLAIDLDGNLLVADRGNNRIEKFGYPIVPARRATWGSLKSLHR